MLSRRSMLLVLTTLVTASFMNIASAKMSDAECDAYVLEANRDAGIGAYNDKKCLNDTRSVGCFADTCRFCQWEKNEQSKYFVHCDEATRLLGATKTEVELYCPALVSPGDHDNGITAYYDLGCTNGGLGCQTNKCRLCKTRPTPKSAVYADCPLPSNDTNTTCINAVKDSKLTSIDFVNHAKCNAEDPKLVGCVPKSKCRLCRKEKNEGNQYLVSCKVLRETQTIEVTQLTGTESEIVITDESTTTDESHEILDATEVSEGSHEILDASTAVNGDLTALSTATSISAAQTAELANADDTEGMGSYAWVAASGMLVLAAVVAVLAIRKSRRRRLDRMNTPRTPTDPTSLISIHTCIATL